MTHGDHSAVTRLVRQMVAAPRAAGLSDAQLLEQFVTGDDPAALEVLVWRHGPKVLGVCRRVLRHEQDAEDAFQVTFLVLVRKARSIGKRQAVGSWLYRVAYRVALRARKAAAKRAARRTTDMDALADKLCADAPWGEVRRVIDEEVDRLPAKYRTPFI